MQPVNGDGVATSEPAPRQPTHAPRALRRALSVWLVFHLSAVIIAPASVSPSADVVRAAWNVCRPYLQVLYLNHGYHFFAPEPSDSTLLAFVAERADGTVVRGRIPHPGIQPRLLYHRYFMLTEHMNVAAPELQRQWYRSYARHLCHKHHATQVSLTRITHHLPTMEMVREGVRLDDPRSYEEQPLGIFRCDSF